MLGVAWPPVLPDIVFPLPADVFSVCASLPEGVPPTTQAEADSLATVFCSPTGTSGLPVTPVGSTLPILPLRDFRAVSPASPFGETLPTPTVSGFEADQHVAPVARR